jgi:hypothetical protein
MRTDHGADAAATTIIHSFIDRNFMGVAKTLGLRPNIFWPRKKFGDIGKWAERGANIALNAQVGGVLDLMEQRPGHLIDPGLFNGHIILLLIAVS